MGAGVAAQIKNRWPAVYKSYNERCIGNIIYNNDTSELLGSIQICPINDHQSVINMFAQDGYGKNGRYTSYDAFWLCLGEIRKCTMPGDSIAFPFGIGCGLGGANWDVILKMIETVLSVEDRKIYIYCKGKY